jgi:hypothetical protein
VRLNWCLTFIYAARSPVFKTMFTSTMLEGKTGSITLNDVDCELFTEMLRFIYTGSCNNATLVERTSDLFALADKVRRLFYPFLLVNALSCDCATKV